MPYLLDSNIFIQAKNLYYGMDFCPGFWDWLVKQNKENQLYSIEKVKDELQAIDDDLSKWTQQRDSQFFLKPDESVLSALVEISRSINEKDYETGAKKIFLQGADYYLIAQAKAREYTIVTHEKPSDSKKKIKIPNVCIGFGIKYMTIYEMLRMTKARLILQVPDQF